MRTIKVAFGAVLAVQLGCAALSKAPTGNGAESSGDPGDPKCARITRDANKLVERDKDEPPRDKKEGTKRLERAELDLSRVEEKLEKANLSASCTEPIALLKARVDSAKQALAAAPSVEQREQARGAERQAKQDAQELEWHGKAEVVFAGAPDGPGKTHFSCGEPIWARVTSVHGTRGGRLGNSWQSLAVGVDGAPLTTSAEDIYIYLPTTLLKTGGEATWNLTPDEETVKKEGSEGTRTRFKSLLVRLAALPPGLHKIRVAQYAQKPNGALAGEFEVECDDFSKSEYANRARAFDGWVVSGARMWPKDLNADVSAKAKRLVADGMCLEKGCVPLLARTEKADPKTFGTIEANGEFSRIDGRGYLVEVAAKNKDGGCSVFLGKYMREYVANERRYEEKYSFTPLPEFTFKIDCANVK